MPKRPALKQKTKRGGLSSLRKSFKAYLVEGDNRDLWLQRLRNIVRDAGGDFDSIYDRDVRLMYRRLGMNENEIEHFTPEQVERQAIIWAEQQHPVEQTPAADRWLPAHWYSTNHDIKGNTLYRAYCRGAIRSEKRGKNRYYSEHDTQIEFPTYFLRSTK